MNNLNNNDMNKANELFYNTTNLHGEELLEQTAKAMSLQELIFEFYKCDPKPKNPFEITTELLKNGYKHPVWSVRRAITNLTADKKLVKSIFADSIGDYKVKNHTWTLHSDYRNESVNKELFPNLS